MSNGRGPNEQTVIVIVLVAIFVAIGGVIAMCAKTAESRASCDADDAKWAAKVIIERHAKGQLYAPDEADFAFEKPVRKSGDRYELVSHLDTLNMYGGPLRLYFYGIAQCVEGGEERRWRITEFSFY